MFDARSLINRWRKLAAFCYLLAAVYGSASGQSIILDRDEERVFHEFNWLPYGFYSESFGLGIGAGGAYAGWPNEAASVLGAATIGTAGSYNMAGAISDLQLSDKSRWTFNPLIISGLYQNQRIYTGYNSLFPDERAGANGSSQDNYIEVREWDNRFELECNYLLPIGHGKDTIIHRYVIDQGLLVRNPSGGTSWNPLESGRTHVRATPAWRGTSVKYSESDAVGSINTLNVELALERDNYDFPYNPTAGSAQTIAFQQDVSGDNWNSMTLELDKVFSAGASDRFRQRVLALNFWTSYSPSWDTAIVDGQEEITSRPPYFEGPRLGGMYRMRAYEDSRWQDKAAIYYSAEVRVIPEWQPLREVDWLNWASIRYWQWVAFVEAGQVAPEYTLSSLHDDLRTDCGISLRGMVYKAVVRLDFAVGEEGGRITAMYGHPF